MKVLRVILGYCNTCQQPKKVAQIEVTGWPHLMNQCEECLEKLKLAITATK